MISASSEKGFFAAHWDWLVALVGLLALAGGVAFLFIEKMDDADLLARDASEEMARLSHRTDTGVEKVDMIPYEIALKENESPSHIDEPAETLGSFLASEKRVFCAQGDDSEHKSCGKPMPADLKVCPYCKTKQPEPAAPKDVDSDNDGMPDEWEAANGLDPNADDANADADSDGYTNFEEFQAGTDPKDPASHPDDLDSLKLQLPLKQTKLQFYLERDKAVFWNKTWRAYFRDDKKSNGMSKGVSYSVVIGDDIGDTGYVFESFEKKTEKKSIKGGQGMGKAVDVSEAVIVRKADKKAVRVIAGAKNTPIDTQAKLVFTRGETKEFDVVVGAEIELNGTKYKVLEITSPSAESARIILKNVTTGKTRTIDAP